MVSQEALVAACGGAAADFKGYQLVGVNFLMLLARAGVGGAILADEMARGPPRACCCPLDERRPRIRLASLHDRRSVGAAPNVCTVVLAVDSAQRGALMMPLLANLYRLIHGVSSLRRAWARPRRRLHSWVRTFDLDCVAELMSPAGLCAQCTFRAFRGGVRRLATQNGCSAKRRSWYSLACGEPCEVSPELML